MILKIVNSLLFLESLMNKKLVAKAKALKRTQRDSIEKIFFKMQKYLDEERQKLQLKL